MAWKFVWVSVCLYPMTVKKNRSGPNWFVGTHITPGKGYGLSKITHFARKKAEIVLKTRQFKQKNSEKLNGLRSWIDMYKNMAHVCNCQTLKKVNRRSFWFFIKNLPSTVSGKDRGLKFSKIG